MDFDSISVGLIKREKTLVNGRWSYRFIVRDGSVKNQI